ncbi:MAG: hypothetical protein HUU56_10945 [Bdellovibrionaceae bacterium]|nr:hypothetical protein [Pseudobdellovibrionaceae bacterium]
MSEINKENQQANILIEASGGLEKSLQILEEINQKANFIALCAAIEGAKMKNRTGTFSIVAQQISNQAQKNNSLSEKLTSIVKKIQSQALDAVAIRNLELAADLIDKLDRNLFERNCDVQAWATFDSIKNAILSSTSENISAACDQLEKLVMIYMVYSESLLLDKSGKIIASAKSRSLIGQNLIHEDWFLTTRDGQVTVTDAHFNHLIKNNTVAYCSPVMSADNEIIGVLANFFNWDFALEMITSGQYSELTNAVIINNRSKVIASAHESQIMQDHYDWLKAGRLSCKQHVGYSLEKARNGESLAVGFCYTKGYNAYRGKGWSAIISESINTTSIPIHAKPLSRRNNDGTTTLVYPEEASSQIDSEKSGLALINTMKEIDELVYEINANNREVKLLAVNASIQAGIAGSDGEGFSIIANEVALLAKKSLNFVETINIATDNLRKVVDESISIRLLDAAKDTSSKVDRNLFERYCDIQAWSTFNKFKEILEQQRFADKEAIELLQKIHKIYEVYHDLYILNVNGDVVASAIDQSMMNQNYENTEWFREALNGQIYYSDIEYAEHLKNPVIKFSSPIINENNEIIGVIVSWFNCNFLNDIIKATIVDSKSETYLINRRSQIIASKTPEEILKKSFKTESFIQNFSPNNSGITNKTPAKNEPAFIMGYSSSKGYNSYKGQNWVVVTQRPKNASQEAQSITPEQKFKQKIKWIV